MLRTQDAAVLTVRGPARARGRVHGEAMRTTITSCMARWKDALGNRTGLPADTYLDRFLAATDFTPAINRWAAHLLDEVRGIGEGAGLPFRDVYAYQLMDEEWMFRAETIKSQGAAPEHCSTIGIYGEDGATLLGQNMDLPKYYDGAQTLLRVVPDQGDIEAFVFTPAGMIGTFGLNSRAVGVCVNTLNQLRHSHRGLPVAFVTRRALECATLAQAAQLIQSVDHAAGQNYAIASPEGIVDFECAAGKTVRFMPGANRIYHTNHPLANDSMIADQTPPASGTPMSNSEQRYALLDRAIGDRASQVDVECIKSVLSTRDVPVNVARNSPGFSITLGSMVMELTGDPVAHYAPGPPAETAFIRLTF